MNKTDISKEKRGLCKIQFTIVTSSCIQPLLPSSHKLIFTKSKSIMSVVLCLTAHTNMNNENENIKLLEPKAKQNTHTSIQHLLTFMKKTIDLIVLTNKKL